jgi:hypothetical protein
MDLSPTQLCHKIEKKKKKKKEKKTLAPVAIQEHKCIIIYFYLHIWLIAKFDKHSTERWPLWLHHKTEKKNEKKEKKNHCKFGRSAFPTHSFNSLLSLKF